MSERCETHKRSPEFLYLEPCSGCELKTLRNLLRAYIRDEDRFNRGEGEPYGSITTEIGAAARRAVKA